MSPSTAMSLLALRDADPAADVDVAALCPDWQTILAELTTDAPPAERRRPIPPRRSAYRWRLAVAGALVAVAAISAGVIGWPWSSGPGSVAYGVTKRPDGTVAVRLSLAHPLEPQDLQVRLRAAGVSAFVIAISPPGACAQQPPTTTPLNQVLSFSTDIDRNEGFVVHPDAMPAGEVLVIALPSGRPALPGSPAFAGLYVTANPPSCIAPLPAGPTSLPPANPLPATASPPK